ncbi:hypothetical protein [Vibrio rumoiensis]|uniref:hypothetical protein n=1 Tax=Vibrio rumoiensis TaxID=76258 RepID=UPI000B5C78DE|nr:hypothetical protein [Vibrio rumoiensis]
MSHLLSEIGGNYSESDLAELLEVNGIISRERQLLVSPDHYLHHIKYYFYNNDKNEGPYNGNQIFYCHSCIKNNIAEYGVGYLKHEWFRNHSCSIHSDKVFTISCSSRSQTLRALKTILSGRVPPGSKINEEIKSTSRRKYKESPIVMASCLEYKFYLWVFRNRKRITDDVACRLGFTNAKRMLLSMNNSRHIYKPSDMNKVSSSASRLESVFYAFWDSGDEALRSFLNAHSKSVNVYFGVFDRRAIQSKIWKFNSYDCYRCPRMKWSESCLASQSIVRWRLYYPVIEYGGDIRVLHEDVSYRRYPLTIESIAVFISKYWPDAKCPVYSRDIPLVVTNFLGWIDSQCISQKKEDSNIELPTVKGKGISVAV